MIRVAVVIEALGRGGAERLLVDTARTIDPGRFELLVFSLYPVRRDYAQALRDIGVAETCLGIAGTRGIPRGIARLGSLLRKNCVDVVHTHLFTAHVVGRIAARLRGIPVISTAHDADYEPIVRRGNPRLTPWKQHVLRMIDRWLFHAANARLVAVSEYVANSMRARLAIPPEKVEIVHNAVDIDVFQPCSTEKRRAIRKTLGLGQETLILCVGRMTPQKGQATLLEAAASLRQSRRLLKLALVGDGACQAEYASLARRLHLENDVLFLGVRSDVPALMTTADLLVLPSLHEGFGLVLVEALAAGIPVVASRVGPIPEIVRDHETGLLFTAGDPSDLAQALLPLVDDPERRKSMGRLGREDVSARFSLPIMVGRLESLYERVVERAKAR